ncbi:TadE/TadG family type IV pilus assembly protein [uncultured Amnibacterium sp.]|uniref:TadE/TadG family type IV pilus assembly protein n=1 Tax=uncultured Amnibacterium sp. TaxID=1631851 RepID=UPI0035CAAA87
MISLRPSIRPGEAGSAPAEFVMVAVLLVTLVLGVLQLGAVLLVRNTALDAAAEGARWAALAGNSPDDGVQRARSELSVALGADYAQHVQAATTTWQGRPVVAVTVTAPLPILGPIGLPGALQLTGHAAVEPAP